jgi:hypothetical protein
MQATPLKVAKMKYIFQLIEAKSGGTPNARPVFHAQLLAVAKDTAFARTLFGKTSAG